MSTGGGFRYWAGVVALAAAPLPLAGQSLVSRLASMGDGALRFTYAARAGVCGSGANTISISDDHDDDENGEWESLCTPGPVRVWLRVTRGEVSSARVYVGGRWRAVSGTTSDLGTLPAARAAHELLTIAARGGRAGEELIMAASLADSVVIWPALLRLARDTSLSEDTRKRAIFWLGQSAGEAATRGLDSIATGDDTEIELRKQAVFSLSQLPAERGVPALIRIARTSPHRELRKSALFWLGESDDPRALSLFEELLTR